MAALAGPPATPQHAAGWCLIDLSSGRRWLVLRTAADAFVYFPQALQVARNASGKPAFALTVLLSRAPAWNASHANR